MKHSEDWYRGYQAGLAARKGGRRKSKLTAERVETIRHVYATGMYSMQHLADMYDVSRMTIHRIVKRKVWNNE